MYKKIVFNNNNNNNNNNNDNNDNNNIINNKNNVLFLYIAFHDCSHINALYKKRMTTNNYIHVYTK